MNQQTNLKVGAYPNKLKFYNTTNKSILIDENGFWLNDSWLNSCLLNGQLTFFLLNTFFSCSGDIFIAQKFLFH